MFFFLLTISMMAYALQSTLLARYARQMDGLSLAIYRNTSFVVVLLPFLLFAPLEDILRVSEFWPELVFMGLAGSVRIWSIYAAMKYLPLGIVSSLSRTVLTIFLILWGFVFFGEVLPFVSLFFVFLILLGVWFLYMYKKHMPHLDNNFMKGFLILIFPAILGSLSFIFMAKVSRELNPLVSGYFWEISVGVFAILMALARKVIFGTGIHRVSKKNYLKIALAVSPTFIGTGALAIAVAMGPIGVAGAVGSASIIVITVLAHFIYNEKLNFGQLIGIFIVVVGLIGLKVFE